MADYLYFEIYSYCWVQDYVIDGDGDDDGRVEYLFCVVDYF